MDVLLDRCEEGTEAISGIQKWIIPCNWKIAAEQFGSDGYHVGTTSHLSGIIAGVPADTDMSQMAPPDTGLNVHLENGHACGMFLRNPVWYPIIVGTEVGDYLTKGPAYEAAVERLGQSRVDINVLFMNVFPNLAFLAGINTVRMWQPRGPNELEVWVFTLVDKSAPDEVKEGWRRNNVRTFSASGVFEQDDSENWTEMQAVLRGHVAQQQTFNCELAKHRVSTENPEGFPGITFSYVFGEEAARGFYRYWTQIMTSPDWDAIRSIGQTAQAAE